MDRTNPIRVTEGALKQKTGLPLKPGNLDHLPKAYVLLYDRPRGLPRAMGNKHSLFFGDMFRSLMSGNSSYCTYLNDLVVGKGKREIEFSDHVRCVIKKMSEGSITYYNEVVGSRLGNLFGVDVVYNTAYKADPLDVYTKGQYDYLLSVDYVPDGYKDFTMFDIGMVFDTSYTLESIMEKIDKQLCNLNETGQIKLTPERREAFLKSFVKQYLFRVLICEDNDFVSRNASILINNEGEFINGPCFDMEQFFLGGFGSEIYNRMAQRDIEYLFRTMPDVLEEFLGRCLGALESGEIDDIMDKTTKANVNREFRKNIVRRNITTLCQIHEKLKNPPVMEE